ncbi:MAG: ABC transporter substrate-binding protein [Burkholderiales bacterium]|nr:ABC transporter substrate-binding protein [Burkholderiales bacterium]
MKRPPRCPAPSWSIIVTVIALFGLLLLTAAAYPVRAAAAQSPGAERLVVLDSTLAEIVVALGAAAQIIGTAAGSEHIAELAQTPRLPGFRQTSAEPILALAPTIVLLGRDRTLPQTLQQLQAAGVAIVKLGDEASEAGVEQRIRAIARLLGRGPQGEALVARFKSDLQSARQWVARARTRPKAVFILAGGGRPTVAGGRGTNTAALLEMAGAQNVADDFEGYKAMSQEALLMAAPEFILTNAEGLAAGGGAPAVLTAPGAAGTPAARSRRLITIPGQYLQGLGLSTPAGIRLLAAQLHPELR